MVNLVRNFAKIQPFDSNSNTLGVVMIILRAIKLLLLHLLYVLILPYQFISGSFFLKVENYFRVRQRFSSLAEILEYLKVEADSRKILLFYQQLSLKQTEIVVQCPALPSTKPAPKIECKIASQFLLSLRMSDASVLEKCDLRHLTIIAMILAGHFEEGDKIFKPNLKTGVLPVDMLNQLSEDEFQSLCFSNRIDREDVSFDDFGQVIDFLEFKMSPEPHRPKWSRKGVRQKVEKFAT